MIHLQLSWGSPDRGITKPVRLRKHRKTHERHFRCPTLSTARVYVAVIRALVKSGNHRRPNLRPHAGFGG